MTFKEKRKALQSHKDIFKIAKYFMWQSAMGNKYAYDIINKVYRKKYKHINDVWIQYEQLLDKLETELIMESHFKVTKIRKKGRVGVYSARKLKHTQT